MPRSFWKRAGTVFLCAVLAGLLGAARAKADLLLFATAEDCAAAPIGSLTPDEPHAAVLQKASKAGKQAVRETLAKAGITETEFFDLPNVKAKQRTAETLEKKWATKENTARAASLIRRWRDGRIIYYAADEEDRRFLSAFADKCAGAANDPEYRHSKQQEDESLQDEPTLTDGWTNEERAATPADTSWRDRWEQQETPDLSGLPETDGEGFLPEGKEEYVLEDEKQGLWVYLSQTLRIVITRHQAKGIRWFEAEVFRRPDGDTLHVVPSLNGRGKDAAKLAAENRLVLGVNTDYYQYRINYHKETGLIIRNGKVIRESSGATARKAMPPLDTLLLDRDGGFRLDEAGELDPEKALELGAADVLAFGPILVKDGHIRMLAGAYHNRKEPRTAVGTLGKNHYLMIVAEGRLTYSSGITLDQMGRLMAARGCTDAINLDGGHTSVLIFMGTRLNRIGNLTGTGMTLPRNMAELLGIGTYSR